MTIEGARGRGNYPPVATTVERSHRRANIAGSEEAYAGRKRGGRKRVAGQGGGRDAAAGRGTAARSFTLYII
jgi:hypothetical protein